MRRRTGATKFGCLVYVLFIAAALYFGIPAGEAYFRYYAFRDAMRQELRFRSNQPNEKIMEHLRLVADSLGLPSEAGYVVVHRNGNQITVESEYEEVLQYHGLKRTIRFTPRAADIY